jgi:hypothetical protein
MSGPQWYPRVVHPGVDEVERRGRFAWNGEK